MNRPLVVAAAALAAGMAVAAGGWLPGMVGPAVAGIAAIVLAAWFRRAAMRTVAVVLCSGAAGALLWNATHAGPPGDALSRAIAQRPTDEVWRMTGAVRTASLLTTPSGPQTLVVDVSTAGPPGKETTNPGRIRLFVPFDRTPFLPGAQLQFLVDPSIRLGAVNPGVRGYEDWLRTHTIHSTGRIRFPADLERVDPPTGWPVATLAARWRHALALRLRDAVPADAYPFVLAVWLGDRGLVDRDTYDAFIQSGTAHVLTVSGIHVAILYATAALLLRPLVRSTRLRSLLLLLILCLFVLLTGARLPTVRAALMLGLYLLSDFFHRERDAPTALAAAAILFLTWNPQLLHDTGFLLSFLSVSSLLLFEAPLQARLTRLGPATARALSAPLSVQLLPLPVALRTFHVLPALSPLVNLAVIPLVGAVLWLCLFTTAAALLVPAAAPLFGHAVAVPVSAAQALTALVSVENLTFFHLASPATAAIAAYVASLLVLRHGMAGRFNTSHVALLAVAALATGALWRPLWPEPEAVFLDVGQGDSTFLRLPQGATVLVDGGDSQAQAGRRIVAPFLWAQGLTALDAVIASHPDRDHIGGLNYILDRFHVGTVVLPAVETGDALEDALLAQCALRGIAVVRAAAGDRLHVGGDTLDVLHPPAGLPFTGSTNDVSLVLRAPAGNGVHVLLPGDIEVATEALLASRDDCRAAVLKAPHHGSQTSSSPAFLDAVDPGYVVVSSTEPRPGAPVSLSVLRRYEERGLRVLRTDRLGGIRVTATTAGLRIRGERQARGYPMGAAPLP